jgi:hypothetical protein
LKVLNNPLPLRWGRVRVGVDKEIQSRFGHPPLDPLPPRGGEFLDVLDVRDKLLDHYVYEFRSRVD